jgi:ATP-dependent DNA helicase HFM1/MER3
MGEEAYYPSRLPRQPVSTRDRYRNTQQYGYDDVEDGDEFEGGGVEFDSFGMYPWFYLRCQCTDHTADDRVLRQAFPDRQRQVEQGGRARLSLAPASGLAKGPGGANLSYPAREHGEHEYRTHVELSARVQPSECVTRIALCRVLTSRGRFAYNANHQTESSSDVPLGPSSSPTLKARNRRVEYPPSTTGHHGGLLQDDGAYVAERRADQLISRLQGRHKPPQRSPSKNEQSQCDTDAYEYPTVAPTVTDLRLAKPQPKLMCQGIQLVPVSSLPDRLRTVFPYPTFNAVQSKCFDTVFMSDDNFVLSSPTGSGKTVILELAICRAIATNATGQYKIVYQAPTKALCSERQRDWEAKFTPIGLRCAELTGDSDAADVRNVQSANIIVTTPEKWDSITRKWKDYEKLMRLVKIFLIDEVHILNEDRGAVLEVVVSRMKSIGTDVRFVALSATVPNFHDVATWLGKNPFEPHLPAASESFGEEFRPVKLQKHVCGYVSQASNDFGFEKLLDAKLPEVITKYSEGKPIMIFCATRKGCEATAKLIANWWITRPVNNRKWKPPTRQVLLRNKGLQETVASGVAFHHAGLNADDRMQVEKGFLSHDINVICCTSTLAVGINLPCHLVIVKNTVSYTNAGLQEYSDLEMMQMLGRAGRPQFDDTAVAVIMTRQAKARQYESMVAGRDMLESTLHSNLVDHMNAEIGLGTIRDLKSARKWLGGTFLYVRLQHNPAHYKLANARSGQSIEEQVDDICFRDISLLREHNLVLGDEHFRSTEFGHAMARYYVHFETMKVFMGIQPKATPSEIVSQVLLAAFDILIRCAQLSAIAQASEFSQIRFRAGEKPFYKLINKAPTVRFSIPVNLDLPAHKVSLIIQAILGAADISFEGGMAKHRSQYTMETQIVFKNVGALIRCIIDCQICLGDSVGIHNALMLERSLGARIWDDSPLQMKQIEGIGVVYVRKLANAGIRSMEDLEACDPHRIETLVSRNPPFGLKVLEMVKAFPKLRVSLYAQPSSVS